MARDHDSDIRFIVEYEDGGTAIIGITPWDLRSGDHVARLIAGEMQAGGRLPNGKIKTVRRAPGQGPGDLPH